MFNEIESITIIGSNKVRSDTRFESENNLFDTIASTEINV